MSKQKVSYFWMPLALAVFAMTVGFISGHNYAEKEFGYNSVSFECNMYTQKYFNLTECIDIVEVAGQNITIRHQGTVIARLPQ